MSKNKLGGINLSTVVFSKDESWISSTVVEDVEDEGREGNQELMNEFTEIIQANNTIEYKSLKENTKEELRNNPSLVLASLKNARIVNYPVSGLKEIKANVIGKFVSVHGSVIKVSQVLQKVKSMNFICGKCGKSTRAEFKDGIFNDNVKCFARCKGKLFPDRSCKTRTIDWQKVKIQEKLYVENSQVPRTIDLELSGDLVDSIIPGDVATISGIVKVISKDQGTSRSVGNQLYQLYIDAHSVEKVKDTVENEKNNVSFTVKDLYGIREIKQDGIDTIKLLVNSFCPKIFGQELVKLGILLVLFGGRNREDALNGVNIRSQPHILIVGDPGLGKSQLLSETVKVAPRGVYVYGDTATAAGLTVNVCKDPDSGDLALEAGALVLVNLSSYIRETRESVVLMNLIK